MSFSSVRIFVSKIKEPSLSYYLSIAGERAHTFMPFPMQEMHFANHFDSFVVFATQILVNWRNLDILIGITRVIRLFYNLPMYWCYTKSYKYAFSLSIYWSHTKSYNLVLQFTYVLEPYQELKGCFLVCLYFGTIPWAIRLFFSLSMYWSHTKSYLAHLAGAAEYTDSISAEE